MKKTILKKTFVPHFSKERYEKYQHFLYVVWYLSEGGNYYKTISKLYNNKVGVLYLWREKPFLKVKIRVNSNTYFEDKDTYYVEFDLKVLEILNSELINYQELFVPVVGKWAKQVYVKNESIDTFSIQEYTDVTAHVLKVEDNFSPDEKETYDYLRGLF